MLNKNIVSTHKIISCIQASPIVRKTTHESYWSKSGSMYQFIAGHFWYCLDKFVINLQRNENDPTLGRKTTPWGDVKLLAARGRSKRLKNFTIILIALFLSGCSGEPEFIQTDCAYLNEDHLIVAVSNDFASRTLSIGSSALTFKGTTPKDMKWLAEFTDIESIEFENEALFKITLKSGFSKIIGRVNSKCRVLIEKHFQKEGVAF